MTRFALIIVALGAGGMAATPADARKREITPYIEISQIVTADLNTNDVLTYSTVAAGVDASISTRRVEAQVSYRYERRFGYQSRLNDNDVHSGLARAAVRVAPGFSVEGGAIATRARADIRGANPGSLVGNVDNISQIYSVYGGPTLGTDVGDLGVSASYRIGYTKAEAAGSTGVAPGQPRLDAFDSSRSQVAQASLNLKAGTVLPVGVTVSGGWERDDATQLDQKYEGKFARADILVPVAGSLAIIGGAGYENIQVTQRDAVLDSSGQPVADRNGRFQTDPASPARIAYRFDGIYYDAGVIWRPSKRTQLEARVGKRYGSTSITGSFSYAPTQSMAIRIGVYDGVQTFGRQLQNGLANIGTSFNANRTGLGGDFNGCVFGAQGGAAGNCLNSALQSVSTAAYRSRGVDAIVSVSRGPLTFGVGAGYANREFLSPAGTQGFTVNGISDESYYAQAFIARALDSNTSIDATAFANYYKSGIAGAAGVYGVGATGSLSRRFGKLMTQGSVGVYSFNRQGLDTAVSVQALLGARYSF
ncbi:hypothetical protein [Sphingomonas sp. 28-63-12]|uniref:hypothetical protein n=1 Tax=Sphingomonas sp. 28-63-12 TaxID=1970434 RepID=UPI000BD13843|nr:MAG: hypothetical protein B7Y47_11450 [Sphingomonas sp. 28-63-12]